MQIILKKEIPKYKIYDIKKMIMLSFIIVFAGGIFMYFYNHFLVRICLFMIPAGILVFVKNEITDFFRLLIKSKKLKKNSKWR